MCMRNSGGLGQCPCQSYLGEATIWRQLGYDNVAAVLTDSTPICQYGRQGGK